MGFLSNLVYGNRKTVTVTADSPESTGKAGAVMHMADGPRDGSGLDTQSGATGNAFFRGFMVTEEFNQKLQGVTGAETYQKMRSDAQVEAVEDIVTLTIKGAKYDIELF